MSRATAIAALIGVAVAVHPPGALLAQAVEGAKGAEAREVEGLDRPPETLVYFDIPTRAPLVSRLLAQANCAVRGASALRIELPGRWFEPPLPLRPVESGRATPVDALASQWAALAHGDAERAVTGWAPQVQPTARALLSDPARVDRYRRDAELVAEKGPPGVDAIVWFDVPGGPTAVLLTLDASTPYTLGMSVGFRRGEGDDFLLVLNVALDTRFALVGRAVQEGQYGTVTGDDALPAGTLRYAEACGTE